MFVDIVVVNGETNYSCMMNVWVFELYSSYIKREGRVEIEEILKTTLLSYHRTPHLLKEKIELRT